MRQEPGDARQRVRSVGIAARLLLALADLGKPAPLGAIARAAGLAPAKAHRYLASLVDAGLVEQRAGGNYGLGFGALWIGLSAIRQTDVVEACGDVLDMVRDATGHSCFCAVFGNRGATIVRQAEATASVVVNVRPGSVLPLARSATGRVCCAYLSEEAVLPVLMDEGALDAVTAARLRADIVRQVSAARMAIVEGSLLAGISAIAVPVLDHRRALAGVLTVLGPSAALDTSPGGPAATALREAGATVSARLGWTPRKAS